MHGVSAIISIVLILMIVIALAAMTYVFSSGIFTATTSSAEKSINQTTKSMLANMKIESMSINTIYFRNIGQSDLSGFNVYINDERADFNLTPSIIKPGEVGAVTLTDFIKENDVVKVTNAQGISSIKKISDPCSQAVICLKFDENIGTKTRDSSNGGIGTIYNGSSECSDPPNLGCPKWISGRSGSALQFDGSNDFVNVSYPSSLNSDYATWELWVYPIFPQPGASPDWRRIYASSGIEIFYRCGSAPCGDDPIWAIEAQAFNQSGLVEYFPKATVINGTWNHVAFTFNRTHLRTFVNGVIIGTNTLAVPNVLNKFNSTAYVGIYYGSASRGGVDEVRFYNKVIY